MKAIKTKEDLKAFWDAFYNAYGEGIFIKSDMHPCGWDYVDLTEYGNIQDMETEPLTLADISWGNYDYHPFVGYSPYDMLQDLEENWCFEESDIDWV